MRNRYWNASGHANLEAAMAERDDREDVENFATQKNDPVHRLARLHDGDTLPAA